MAAPVVASTNNVGGGIDSSVPNAPLPTTNKRIHTQTFKRTFQHYISNNNESQLPTATRVDTGTNIGIAYREGWYWLPYTHTRAAMTQADRDNIIVTAKRFRIVSNGFKIERLVAMQQEVIPAAATTRVTNTFVQAPAALMFKDSNHDIFEWTYNSAITLPLVTEVPIWQVPQQSTTITYPNDNFTTPFALSAAQGALNLTMQVPPAPATDGAAAITQAFSLMHGGNIEMIQSGGKYEYTWHNPVAQWKSPGTINTPLTTTSTAHDEFGTIVGGSTPPGTSNFPEDTVTLYENLATDLTQNVWNGPVLHLMRVPPLFNATGAVTTVMELLVEYHVTVEWEEGNYYQTRINTSADVTYLGRQATYIQRPIAPNVVSLRNIFQQFDSRIDQVDPNRARVEQARGRYGGKKSAI
uniref:Capsid protein n=1 Tax=Parvoviridae sp. TaxID=1940570 RepID=A0A7D3QJ94_9VIRU|nr:MAG: hypothetical protein [Parvoviridae sp.]